MFRKIIRPLLFALPVEQAHRVALTLLRLVGFIPGGRWLLRKINAVESPSLEREVFGIKFRNPVGLAAGFDHNGDAFRELAALGFGFIEIGTVTPRPQAGNPSPRIFRLPTDLALINRTGLPNRGLERTLFHLRHPHENFVVGCSIGKNSLTPPEDASSDYLKLFRNLYQYVDYFTVNLDCDDSSHEGANYARIYILEILEPLFEFRRGQNQYRPIMLKVSPDISDTIIDEISDILRETPLDGIVATDGTHARKGLKTSPESIEAIGNGRLSGGPLRERALEVIRRIHTRSGGNFPIIGVGGILTPEDAQAMLEAGADLVQIYTGFIYDGPRLVSDICRSLIPVPAGNKTNPSAAESAKEETPAADTTSAKEATATYSSADSTAAKEGQNTAEKPDDRHAEDVAAPDKNEA